MVSKETLIKIIHTAIRELLGKTAAYSKYHNKHNYIEESKTQCEQIIVYLEELKELENGS